MKEELDKVYSIGFKNGQLEMKYKILKAINRDWSLVAIRKPLDVAVKIMKKISLLRLIKPKL